MENGETKSAVRRHRGGLVLLCTALSVALLVPGAEARKPPKQTGPLNFDERQCSRKTEQWRNRKTGRMETVARSKTCVLLYHYDPLAEDDRDRNYGVVWVQSKVEPRNGWCARKVSSNLFVSKDTAIHRRTPKRKAIKAGRVRQVKIELTTEARGKGEEKGTLSETISIFPRGLQHSMSQTDASRIFRQRWTGLRGGPLKFASGAEISWAVDDPPDALSSGLSYRFEKRGICK